MGGKIFEAIKDITHIEGQEGKTPLALGIRNDSIELSVKYKSKKNKEKVSIKFPG